MSQIQQLEPATVGKGIIMRFFIDHAQPADSIDRHWTETTYDGEPGSDFLQIPAHWHKHHDEFMEVLEGRMSFTLEGKTSVLSVGDAPLRLPRTQVHGFQCFKGEKAILKEKTDPAGDFKELFFRDMLQMGRLNFFIVIRAFYDGDTYLAVPGNLRIVDEVFTAVAGTIAKAFVPAKLVVVKQEDGERDALAIKTPGSTSKL